MASLSNRETRGDVTRPGVRSFFFPHKIRRTRPPHWHPLPAHRDPPGGYDTCTRGFSPNPPSEGASKIYLNSS